MMEILLRYTVQYEYWYVRRPNRRFGNITRSANRFNFVPVGPVTMARKDNPKAASAALSYWRLMAFERRYD